MTRGSRRLIGALLTLSALAVPAVAQATPPQFSAPIKLDPNGGTEPRMTVTPNDHRFVITNSSAAAVVFRSTDKGATWTKTEADPAGQTQPTIDTDIVAFPSGRVLGSELDLAGINFPSSVTDDEGKTWTQAVGSTQLVDQDRQWFAVGPDNHVYLLYHN